MLNKIVLNGNVSMKLKINALRKIESLMQITYGLKLQTTFVIEKDEGDSDFVFIFKRKHAGKIMLLSSDFRDSTYFLGGKELSVLNSENRKVNVKDEDSIDMIFNTIYYLINEFKNDFKSNTVVYIENLEKESNFSTELEEIETLYEFNCEQDQEGIIDTILKIKHWF